MARSAQSRLGSDRAKSGKQNIFLHIQPFFHYIYPVDTSGLFRNYYYFYRDCPYAGYDEITYNSYGVILNREPVYKCGEIYFETDKDGVITNFVENGHIPDTDYQPIFKDLIVIEK